jgi:hypothetical protein
MIGVDDLPECFQIHTKEEAQVLEIEDYGEVILQQSICVGNESISMPKAFY